MKAIVANEYGGPEVLTLVERPDPVPADDEIAFRVAATSVNMVDTSIRRGSSGAALPFTLGLDAVGIVTAVGKNVTRFVVGDRVTAFTQGGSYSEMALARESLAYRVPENASDDAVCSMVAMVAAWNILHHAGRMVKGDRVLIHSAAGTVGKLAVQVARIGGASEIVGLLSDTSKAADLIKLGADEVLSYSALDGPMAAMGREFDVILDANAGANFAKNLDVLASDGRLVCFGHASGTPAQLTTAPLLDANRSVIGYSSADYRVKKPEFLRTAAETMIKLAAGDDLVMPVAAKFPLREAAEAHLLIESRKSAGKVILIP